MGCQREEDILKKLQIVLGTNDIKLSITILARVAYDGAVYYDMEAKEKRDKTEKELRYRWEREQEQ